MSLVGQIEGQVKSVRSKVETSWPWLKVEPSRFEPKVKLIQPKRKVELSMPEPQVELSHVRPRVKPSRSQVKVGMSHLRSKDNLVNLGKSRTRWPGRRSRL